MKNLIYNCHNYILTHQQTCQMVFKSSFASCRKVFQVLIMGIQRISTEKFGNLAVKCLGIVWRCDIFILICIICHMTKVIQELPHNLTFSRFPFSAVHRNNRAHEVIQLICINSIDNDVKPNYLLFGQEIYLQKHFTNTHHNNNNEKVKMVKLSSNGKL